MNEITALDYIKEVNNAGEGITVFLNFYQPYNEITLSINNSFEELAKKYPKHKFLKSVANKCVENFPDQALPQILVYRDGKMINQIQRNSFTEYSKLTQFSLEHLFGNLGLDGFNKTLSNKNKGRKYI